MDCDRTEFVHFANSVKERAAGLTESQAVSAMENSAKTDLHRQTSAADCVLPDVPKFVTAGQYYEFERVANGADGYFEESSDVEDDDFGEHEDNSFSFNMCQVRKPHQAGLNSLPDIVTSRKPSGLDIIQHHEKDESLKGLEDGMDPEDLLCSVHECYSGAPPLAQEDDFDALDE